MAKRPIPQPTSNLSRIAAMLRQEDKISVVGRVVRLVMGVLVLLIVGVVVASVMALVFGAILGINFIGWLGWYLLYLVILTPLIIWYERRSRPDYLLEAARSVDPNPLSFGEYKLDEISESIGMIASFLTWSPRSVVDGIHGLRGLRAPKLHAAFDRAALVALDLNNFPGGVDIKEVMHPPETMPTFALAIDLLEKHGWIGKSKDGKSLWLDSTWRPKIRAVIR